MGFFLFKAQARLGLSQTACITDQAICRDSMKLRLLRPRLKMM